MVIWFLKGLERVYLQVRDPTPMWDLNFVLSKLTGPLFESSGNMLAVTALLESRLPGGHHFGQAGFGDPSLHRRAPIYCLFQGQSSVETTPEIPSERGLAIPLQSSSFSVSVLP